MFYGDELKVLSGCCFSIFDYLIWNTINYVFSKKYYENRPYKWKISILKYRYFFVLYFVWKLYGRKKNHHFWNWFFTFWVRSLYLTLDASIGSYRPRQVFKYKLNEYNSTNIVKFWFRCMNWTFLFIFWYISLFFYDPFVRFWPKTNTSSIRPLGRKRPHAMENPCRTNWFPSWMQIEKKID